MSTPTKNSTSTTTQQAHRTKATNAALWSARKARAQLARSFSRLSTQSGPTPWAEIEITEE